MPPSVNHYYQKVKPFRNKRGYTQDRILSSAGKKWKNKILIHSLEKRIKPYSPQAKVWMKITFQHQHNRKWDIDNRLKALWDSLIGVIYIQDHQVHKVEAKKTKGETDTTTVRYGLIKE